MKQTKQILLNNNEIDLFELIRQLWKEKIIILFISLIFTVAGYLYGTVQPKIYKTQIIIREAPSSLFESYHNIFSTQQQQQQSIVAQFNEEVRLKLLSSDTLVQFVANNNKISNFKNHLNEKDISVRKYFSETFKLVTDKNIRNKYSLTYSQILPGETFLNDYILFAHQQALIIFKEHLMKQIIADINLHEQHLKIAEGINLQNPILKSMGVSQAVVNEPLELFYKGTIVLSKKISYLTNLLNKTKDLTLDYDPVLEQASVAELISISPTTFAFIAFFLGLFLSSIIILIRNIKK